METIGFVGLGRMGSEMARHLVAAGHRVIGVDTSPEARDHAAASGVETSDDLEALDETRIILSSLPDTPHVEDVYLGGLLQSLEAGALCLDLSTIDVATSQRIASEAARLGHHFLDCPVGGTSLHAREGSLVVMAGGDAGALERARPLLACFSAAVHHIGDNGAGLEMKLITNRLLTSHLVSIAEAILEIEQAGIEIGLGVSVLAQGPVPRLLEYKAPPMAHREHSPHFTVDLMSKDLRLAATRSTPGSMGSISAEIMWAAEAEGLGGLDISAVIEVLSAGGR